MNWLFLSKISAVFFGLALPMAFAAADEPGKTAAAASEANDGDIEYSTMSVMGSWMRNFSLVIPVEKGQICRVSAEFRAMKPYPLDAPIYFPVFQKSN